MKFGRLTAEKNKKKAVLIISVIFNIGMLFVFKYLTYTLTLFRAATHLHFSVPNITLPIGISFFTFQAMSYVIDAYKEPSLIRKNILDIFLYISFFPQLIAGPIIKFDDIALQINNRSITSEKTVEGIKRFVSGLAKKVLIANTMGYAADTVFAVNPSRLNIVAAWIGIISYTLQIYYDFSGYSDMAIGLGKLFGFEFKENFNYPLAASCMTDFWRKWNISVSTWFKEYVYIPLGGNRKGKARTIINKLTVFLLTGIWHGANLTFVVWGLMHGLALLAEGLTQIPNKLRIKQRLNPLLRVYTLLFVMLTFVFFRADTLSAGWNYLTRLFSGFDQTVASGFSKAVSLLSPYYLLTLAAGVALATPLARRIKQSALSGTVAKAAAYHYATAAGALVLLLLCVLALSAETYNPFIYFRF